MRQIALRVGWTHVAALNTFALLLRPDRVLSDKLHPLLAGMAGGALRMHHKLRRGTARAGSRALDVRSIESFDGEHDRLWESVRHEYACAVVRDASYLNWKYVTQPGQDYVRLEFRRDGELAAAAVLGFDEPGEIFRYRRAFLVDLIVPPSDTELVRGVLDGVRDYCQSLDVDALLFHVINDPLEKLVRAYGFLPRRATRYLLVNPHRTPAAARELLLDPKSWLITMGDSDIDRPWETDGTRVQVRTMPSSLIRQGQPSAQGASAV
jgi:hypothetical protein